MDIKTKEKRFARYDYERAQRLKEKELADKFAESCKDFDFSLPEIQPIKNTATPGVLITKTTSNNLTVADFIKNQK